MKIREKLTFRGLIISLKELNIAKPADPERFVMEDGLTELLDGLYRYQVQIVNLDMYQADSKEKLLAVLQLLNLKPEECLLLAATDKVMSLAQELDLACMGYLNPRILGQRLSQAQMLAQGFEEVDVMFLKRVYQRKHQIPWTLIETRRCILREITLEDLDDLYELYQGKAITKYMEGLYENRVEEEEYTKAYIQNMYQFYGYGMWVAVEKATGKVIARAGLDHMQLPEETVLQLGYVVGEQYQKQGYATELCEAILDYAKNHTQFAEIYCFIQKENHISIHLAEKLGFIWKEDIKIRRKSLQKYVKSLYNVD